MDLKLTSPTTIKKIINDFDFDFTKSLGQNFLIDENTLDKILGCGELKSDDQVLEIGPGMGTMTRKIAPRVKKVVAVEIDKALLPVLDYTLKDFNNVKVINEDFLKLSLHDLAKEHFSGGKFKVMANLPYYITSPVVIKLAKHYKHIELMVFMLQKEVGERIVSNPGSKDYGVLSVILQFFCRATLVYTVPKTVFMPRPKVDSAVLKLQPRKNVAQDIDVDMFFKVVKASFSHRRKTIFNSLKKADDFKGDADTIKKVLDNAGIDRKRRAETLDIEEFIKLTKAFQLAF